MMNEETQKIKTESETKRSNRPAGILGEEQWHYIRNLYHLTARELQVAILVCRSFDNKEIADVLKISPGTVKTHLRNIYRRVHVKSKISLLLKFIEDIKEAGVSSEKMPPFLRIPIEEKNTTTQQPSRKIEKLTRPA